MTQLHRKVDVLLAAVQGQLCCFYLSASRHHSVAAFMLTQAVCFFRMSLQIFNDENVTGDKSAENCDFLFSPPELTGRSSVLRLSQKENVPPKSIAKAVKVSALCPCEIYHVSHVRSP